ncbi:MAG: PEP-CTERM sorting domain-containing protein [Lentisphaeraceae bacterium]|nr:PEP-CTERM sorting domain-containing protein [Lentisphaeraceae bacterium]
MRRLLLTLTIMLAMGTSVKAEVIKWWFTGEVTAIAADTVPPIYDVLLDSGDFSARGYFTFMTGVADTGAGTDHVYLNVIDAYIEIGDPLDLDFFAAFKTSLPDNGMFIGNDSDPTGDSFRMSTWVDDDDTGDINGDGVTDAADVNIQRLSMSVEGSEDLLPSGAIPVDPSFLFGPDILLPAVVTVQYGGPDSGVGEGIPPVPGFGLLTITLDTVITPEPSSYALMLIAALGLVVAGRRRKLAQSEE